ncbi:MAG TPA: hypothetical protein VGB98_22840 [Pyrinomonadaceae bacterium]|jgi:hypothetical protein
MSRKPRLHPGLVVCLVAFLMVGGLLLVRYTTPERVEARVTLLERGPVADTAEGASVPNVFSEKLGTGEAYVNANRVSELSDLVLRIGLYRWKSEIVRHVPLTIEGLFDGLRAENRLPPGMELAAEQGKLNTPYSTFFVRYRAIPFAVEVVSVPRSERKGGAMLLRLPADPNEPIPVEAAVRMEVSRLVEGVTTNPQTYYAFYTSEQTTSAQLPPLAFVPPAEMIQYGWNKESLPKPARMTSQQLAELKNWLDRVNH